MNVLWGKGAEPLVLAAEAVMRVTETNRFEEAVHALSTGTFKRNLTIITGIGKSFLVAQRAAATMRSFGINAWAESATDLLHGGLGCRPTRLVAVSHSGRTAEVLQVAALHPVAIGITSHATSPLAKLSGITLTYDVTEPEETCGLPITACYVQAGILDALTLAVARRRHMTPATVARWHPGGDIGRRNGE